MCICMHLSHMYNFVHAHVCKCILCIKFCILRFGFYRMQGGIEAEREERERWINKDVKKMMDSVAGIASFYVMPCCCKEENVVYSVYHLHVAP